MGLDPLTWALIGSTTIAGGSAVAQMSQANRTKKRSNSLRLDRTRQAELSNRVSEANRRRQARITSARARARGAASGIGGSILDAPLIGINTSLEGQLDINNQQTESQIRQFNIANAQTAAEADGSIASALGTFASTAFSNYQGMSFKTPVSTGKTDLITADNPLGLTPGQGLA